MRTLVYRLLAPRMLVLTDEVVDINQVSQNQIFAKTLVTCVSPGTEIAAFSGSPALRPGTPYPRVVGYCNVAEIMAVGSAVKSVEVGMRILTAQSHRSAFITSANDVMAIVPMSLDPVAASTTYLFHLGYYALLRANAIAGMKVAVIGLGAIGLCTCSMARLAGMDVVGVSRRTGDWGVFGVEVIVDTEDQAARNVDIVVVTSNRWEDWLKALQLARRGGCISVIGFPGREFGLPQFNPLDSQYFYDKELSIVSCGNPISGQYPSDIVRFTVEKNCDFILKKISSGALPWQELVTSVFNASDLGQIYEQMLDRSPDLLCAALDWRCIN
jgi:threonine dehydrogenase-like Zn-dependent dehydrogenase